jgi:hypothetical protein
LETEPTMLTKRSWKKLIFASITAAVLIAGGAILYIKLSKPASPVPASVSSNVNFKIYYPDQARLPAGYRLDLGSFRSPVKNGVAYSVSYGNGKKIVFSVQTKPSDQELQSFNTNYIPLKLDFQTALGQGEIGAYNGQTLASLPIVNGPWVVVTAPDDVNQDHLKHVMRSLKTD